MCRAPDRRSRSAVLNASNSHARFREPYSETAPGSHNFSFELSRALLLTATSGPGARTCSRRVRTPSSPRFLLSELPCPTRGHAGHADRSHNQHNSPNVAPHQALLIVFYLHSLGPCSYARAQAARADLQTDGERTPDLPMRKEPVGDKESVGPTGFHAEPPCGKRAGDGCDRR